MATGIDRMPNFTPVILDLHNMSWLTMTTACVLRAMIMITLIVFHKQADKQLCLHSGNVLLSSNSLQKNKYVNF